MSSFEARGSKYRYVIFVNVTDNLNELMNALVELNLKPGKSKETIARLRGVESIDGMQKVRCR